MPKSDVKQWFTTTTTVRGVDVFVSLASIRKCKGTASVSELPLPFSPLARGVNVLCEYALAVWGLWAIAAGLLAADSELGGIWRFVCYLTQAHARFALVWRGLQCGDFSTLHFCGFLNTHPLLEMTL